MQKGKMGCITACFNYSAKMMSGKNLTNTRYEDRCGRIQGKTEASFAERGSLCLPSYTDCIIIVVRQ